MFLFVHSEFYVFFRLQFLMLLRFPPVLRMEYPAEGGTETVLERGTTNPNAEVTSQFFPFGRNKSCFRT